MARRRTIYITFEGWYYLGILGFILTGAILREINLLVALFGLLLGPFLISWWKVIATTSRLTVRRKLPSQVCAGQLLVVDIEAENNKRFQSSWAVDVQDTIEREDRRPLGRRNQLKASVFFSRTKAGSTSRRSYEGRLTDRGRYRFGPLRVASRFPWGLWNCAIWLDEPATLTVVPRLGRLTARWRKVRQQAIHGSREVRGQQGLVEGDFHGLRQWRSGDSQRWIHWRTSARTGDLMVRQFEQQRNEDLTVLVDLWQPEQPSREQLENVELAVSFVATVASDQCRRGGSQFLIAVAGHETAITRGPASMALLQNVLEGLSVAQAASADRLPALLVEALAEVRQGTNVVLVSTRNVDLSDTERFEKLWSDARLRRWAGRIACLDSGARDFSTYFQAE